MSLLFSMQNHKPTAACDTYKTNLCHLAETAETLRFSTEGESQMEFMECVFPKMQ